MTKTPTMADAVIRECFRPHTLLPHMIRRPINDVRNQIAHARKIVLDPGMSRFLADLSNAPFAGAHERRPETLDCIRHSARLPHPVTWIEWDARSFRQRLLELKTEMTGVAKSITGERLEGPEQVPLRFGYLLEEHPQLPTAIRVQEFAWLDDDHIVACNFEYVWQCDDNPLPWGDADPKGGHFTHGILGYVCPQIGVRYYDSPESRTKAHDWTMVKLEHPYGERFIVPNLLVEMTGSVRYLLSFLATFNDLPVTYETVRQSKGYVARGSYRKYLDHTVLHINIPGHKDPRILAKQLIVATRRKQHWVRGHWRVFTHHAQHPEKLCSHAFHHGPFATFGPDDDNGYQHCKNCEARRTWIARHSRGDVRLGIVLHDYAIHHEQQKEKT